MMPTMVKSGHSYSSGQAWESRLAHSAHFLDVVNNPQLVDQKELRLVLSVTTHTMVKSERCSGDTGISLRVLVHFPAGLQKPGSTDEPELSPWTAATRHDGKRVNEPLGTASL